MPLSRITNPFLGTSGYRSVTDFTATAGQTSFTVPSYAVGYIDVYRNGVKLAAADFTATSGTTVVLANPVTLGDVITAISTYMGTATNLSVTGGTINGQLVVNSATGVNPFITQVNSTEVLRIDSSGNVGIGTASPSSLLNVVSNTNAQSWVGLRNNNAGSSASTGVLFGNDGNAAYGTVYLNSSTNSGFGAANGMVAGTYGAYPLAFITSSAERMRIDSAGNVGIGTALPGYKLEVKGPSATAGQLSIHDGTGDTTVSGNNAASLLFQVRDTSIRTIAEIDAQNTTTNGTGGAMIFQTRVSDVLAERMRIDSSGNLLVGTISQPITSANCRCIVAYATNDYAIGIRQTGTSPYGMIVNYSTTLNNTTNEFLVANDSTTTRFTVRSNGGIANYSTNNSNLSDVRTKTNIENAGNYLTKICAIPVRTFKYKDQTDDLLNLGCIAQEVEAIAPELVDTTGFGETPDDGIPLKSIYQTDLQYALMKCIQEQQVLITQLQADVAALKGKP
jgi:hypothetical protein